MLIVQTVLVLLVLLTVCGDRIYAIRRAFWFWSGVKTRPTWCVTGKDGEEEDDDDDEVEEQQEEENF